MHSDEIPWPESDLDLGRQGVTYLRTNFLARFGRYRHQRWMFAIAWTPTIDP